ncbi:MAG: acetylornithine/N-succinyldiaminopimelate aminotransferase [Cryomorphaceae bacterium]|jgi:acetylornithine/N-succinyldiaminopimelate aminotransferase
MGRFLFLNPSARIKKRHYRPNMLDALLNRFRKSPQAHHAEPALMSAYARLPICFVRGEACTLWDSEGNQYLDALGGIAVTFLGHSHPTISETISLQASKLLHTSNLFHIQEQARLGERFCEISAMDKVFFGNSGAEANEAAIKISRLYAASKGIKNPVVITMQDSFHGRTMATLSATGNANIQNGFQPLVPDFQHVAYNNLAAINEHSSNHNVVAVMVEPIQGEAGIVVPDEGYLRGIRELCDQNNWLMIVDEIQTGMGRTGEWFAHMHEGIQPDIMTSAKALGNGIPIGACAARGDAADLIGPGNHGSTFGGSPFASQVAYMVIDTIVQQDLVKQAGELGAFLKKQLQQKLGTHPKVVDIRGLGLMIGIELDDVYPDLAKIFLAHGLVVNITGAGKVIRLLPAVVITRAQIKQCAQTILDVIETL